MPENRFRSNIEGILEESFPLAEIIINWTTIVDCNWINKYTVPPPLSVYNNQITISCCCRRKGHRIRVSGSGRWKEGERRRQRPPPCLTIDHTGDSLFRFNLFPRPRDNSLFRTSPTEQSATEQELEFDLPLGLVLLTWQGSSVCSEIKCGDRFVNRIEFSGWE